MKNKFLHSRVARRIFTLFVTCALLPMAVLMTLSFLQTSRQLRRENQHQLQLSAKSTGLALYERLITLDSEMRLTALRIRHRDPLPSSGDGSHFLSMAVLNGQTRQTSSTTSISDLTKPERDHLLTGKSLIRVAPCSADGREKCVKMIVMIDQDDPKVGLLAGEVNSAYLWSPDRLSSEVDLYILSSNELLYSSDPEKASVPPIPGARNASGILEWRLRGKIYDAAYRDLFLRPEFLADTWTIVLSQNQRDAIATLHEFRNTLILVTLLAMWIVVLFSLIQIRHTIGPLEKLSEGTKRIAEQDFLTRVNVASGDEFEDLATSFNAMSRQLGRQFHTLHVINEIHQGILSSLNRDAVVSTALSRMSSLLPSDCFAIATFQKRSSGRASVQVTISAPQSDRSNRCTVTDRVMSSNELQEFQQHRCTRVLLESENTPDFLVPFKELGMKSAYAFSILLDEKLFAALLCGHSQTTPMLAEDLHHAEQIADQLAVAFSNVQLVEAMEQLHWGTLTALARAIDAKSTWTAGHSERVTQLALRIGTAMGLSARDLQVMHRGGLLHDVGKIGISREVLDKPGSLTPQEMQNMRDHVRIGIRILEPIAAFTDALPIVAQHHEWFNGAGYPAGLAGEEISLLARILAVADCFDALVSDRPYRKGLPVGEVVTMLRQRSGTQFDPNVISVFDRLFAEEGATREMEREAPAVAQIV